MLNISDNLKLELSSLEQDCLLQLFDIDLTKLESKSGTKGSIYRLHSGLNEVKKNVVWKGKEYTPYPIKAEGFELKATGTSNRPTLTIGNLFGLVTALTEDFNDCLGAVVTRRQVLSKYLDPVNFVNHTNPNYDPNNEIVSQYIIEQVSTLTHEIVTFTLAIPTELDGLLLPARPMMSNVCPFVYRSVECGYTGRPVADEKDNPTTDPKKDKCSKCLSGCKLRDNEINFGAFIAINKL